MFNTKLKPNSPAAEAVQKWKSRGIVAELDEINENIFIRNYNYDEKTDSFLPPPPEAVAELKKYSREIINDLRFWELARRQVTNIWMRFDPEYRKQYENV
jgi:hypothetical protein